MTTRKTVAADIVPAGRMNSSSSTIGEGTLGMRTVPPGIEPLGGGAKPPGAAGTATGGGTTRGVAAGVGATGGVETTRGVGLGIGGAGTVDGRA